MVEPGRDKEIDVSESRSLNIWIISLFEATPVDNTRPMRFAGLTDAALKNGHHITHFSCTFRHSTKFERFKEQKEIQVKPNHDLVFIYGPAYKANISWARMRSHEVFTRNLIEEFKRRKTPNVIFVTLPPLSSVNAVCQWGEKLNIPVVVDIIDPWPDVFLTLARPFFRPMLKILFLPFYQQLKAIFRRSSAVTSISNEYVNWAKSFGQQIEITGSFYPAVDFEGMKKSLSIHSRPRINDKLRIIYAGNLASSYDIPCILSAAEIVENKWPGRTEFVICGVGPQAKLITDKVTRMTNIKYLGRLGHVELMEQYAISDLGLTQHVRGATQSVTYKFFDYLGASLPILNSLQSEMATLISHHELGLNNEPSNFIQLSENIIFFLRNPQKLALYKQNAANFTSEHGDAKIVYGRLVQLLEQTAKKSNQKAVMRNIRE